MCYRISKYVQYVMNGRNRAAMNSISAIYVLDPMNSVVMSVLFSTLCG